MKHAIPSLDSLKYFEAAARHLSFTAAAEDLCVSKGAVSYQVKRLENTLGTALFRREVRQVLLTTAGQTLYPVVQSAMRDIENELGRLSGQSATAPIVIAATTYVAARWLSPLVTGFSAEYPKVNLQFQHAMTDQLPDPRDYDLAVVWESCTGDLDEDRLRELPMALFPAGSPELVATLPGFETRSDLGGVTLLCEDRDQDLWDAWALGHYDLTDNPRRIIADANVRAQAAIDGQGPVLADELMQAELQSASLTRLTDRELTGYGYVIRRSGRPGNSMTRALADWLVAA